MGPSTRTRGKQYKGIFISQPGTFYETCYRDGSEMSNYKFGPNMKLYPNHDAEVYKSLVEKGFKKGMHQRLKLDSYTECDLRKDVAALGLELKDSQALPAAASASHGPAGQVAKLEDAESERESDNEHEHSDDSMVGGS